MARYGVLTAIALGFFTGRYGWIGYILVLCAYLLALMLANTVVILLFGHTLEPVAEAGHIPLGESAD